jgi:DNA-binding transcriptional ArsR family regulator
MLPFRGGRAVYSPHYFFVFVASVFGKLIMASRNQGSGDVGGNREYFDRRFKRLLWYLIGSTKGGYNRARILEFINLQPANANQIASELRLDYKTIIHHIAVLSKNGLVTTDNKESYGAIYFVSPLLEKNYESFKREILARIGKK